MNGYYVYDFDGTIYAGDSSKDFFLFVLRRHPAAALAVPKFLCYAGLYLLKKCTKEQMKERYFAFLRHIPDISLEVEQFWAEYGRKLYPWYLEREHSADIIISASPEFLLEPLMRRYEVAAVISTVIDPQTGRFLSPNCYGEEKVTRLKKLFQNPTLAYFYSDSKTDAPLARLAKHAYLVKNGSLTPWR